MPCFRTEHHTPVGAPVFPDRDFALPGDLPHYPPDRPIDIRHIDLRLQVDFASQTLEGTCSTTLSALFEEVRTVEFQAAEMEIAGVAFTSKRRPQPIALEYDYDGAVLHIRLDRPLRHGQECMLTVAYRTHPRIGMNFVGPRPGDPWIAVQAHTQSQPEYAHYWFPCHDAPNERATMAIAARVPQPYIALANGRLNRVEEHPEANERTFFYEAAFPFAAYLATLVVGEFTELRDEFGPTPVFYYVRPGFEEHAHRMMGDTPAMLAYYSEHFGLRYPYDRYAQICLEEFTGAMENTGATSHT